MLAGLQGPGCPLTVPGTVGEFLSPPTSAGDLRQATMEPDCYPGRPAQWEQEAGTYPPSFPSASGAAGTGKPGLPHGTALPPLFLRFGASAWRCPSELGSAVPPPHGNIWIPAVSGSCFQFMATSHRGEETRSRRAPGDHAGWAHFFHSGGSRVLPQATISTSLPPLPASCY